MTVTCFSKQALCKFWNYYLFVSKHLTRSILVYIWNETSRDNHLLVVFHDTLIVHANEINVLFSTLVTAAGGNCEADVTGTVVEAGALAAWSPTAVASVCLEVVSCAADFCAIILTDVHMGIFSTPLRTHAPITILECQQSHNEAATIRSDVTLAHDGHGGC